MTSEQTTEATKITATYLAQFLGRTIEEFLSGPFDGWLPEVSVEGDLVPILTDYVFPDRGLAVVCNDHNVIQTIFVHSTFEGGLADLPSSLCRRQIIERLGTPSKSGEARNSPILGSYGPWDRFDHPAYSLHVQYGLEIDQIVKVTLMRSDIVP